MGEATRFGVESSAPTLAFGTTMARKAEVVGTLFKGLSGLLKSRKVTMFSGVGTLQADRSVVVAGLEGERTQITGDAVILASGSAPRGTTTTSWTSTPVLSVAWQSARPCVPSPLNCWTHQRRPNCSP